VTVSIIILIDIPLISDWKCTYL